MPPILEVQNLVKKYGDFTAVKGVSFDINEGEIFLILLEFVVVLKTPYLIAKTGRFEGVFP